MTMMTHKSRLVWTSVVAFALVVGLTKALSTIHTTARKRLKKSSYFHRHDLGSQSPPVSSPDELKELLQKTARRKYGSTKYRKRWRHFLQSSSNAIRQELSDKLPDPVDRQAHETLSFRLGVAADTGEMPSFADSGARSGYALDFFCRARNLADLLMDRDDPTFPVYWSESLANSPMLGSAGRDEPSKPFRVTSIAGGPGYDFVAVALVALYAAGSDSDVPSIRTTVLDYEPGWSNLVNAMEAATQTVLPNHDFSCEWGGKCDITQPLSHHGNAACMEAIDSTHLWTCQYCVAENAQRLEDSGRVFFKELFEAVPEGALFVLTETTPYLWPSFCQLVEEHCPYMQVGFPNKHGYQMVLRKGNAVDGFSLSSADQELLCYFETISKLRREQKSENRRGRQEQKIRGLVV
jgi:hypothetical protein